MVQDEGAGPIVVVEDEGAGLIVVEEDEGAGLIVVVEDKGAGQSTMREDKEHQGEQRDDAKTKTVTNSGDSHQDGHKAGDKTDQHKAKEQENTKDTGGYKRPTEDQEKGNE